MKRLNALLLALVALFTNGCVVLFYQSVKHDREIAAKHGKKFEYTVKPAPPFLTDDLALAKARETLRREGFNTNEWMAVPTPYPRKAPDGTQDKYLSRFVNSTSSWPRGTIVFQRGDARRKFDVRLDGKRIVCYSLFTGKRLQPTRPPLDYSTPPRSGKS